MGAYKGRLNLRHRKKRFLKAQRIRALSATKRESTAAPQATSKDADQVEGQG
jgi:hypothetical protein